MYEELEAIDADGAPGRAASLLRGLQFTEDMMRKPVASLSGGWRMRVSIAAALFQVDAVSCVLRESGACTLTLLVLLCRPAVLP